ncbi:hypothetical protein E4T56_gene10155 [Termitomyces sp. T112]|nr:hypothetical protein E4T56_gene10155 [Termitomyces sp. T112]
MLIGFVDDAMFLAVAWSLKEAHKVLADMMEHAQGGFDWSQQHNSPFELTKLALMNFPRSLAVDDPSSLTLSCTNSDRPQTTQSVAAIPTYKYLGVYFDSKLRWLSRILGGMPAHQVRQLYNTVAVPAFMYAVDVWFMGVSKPVNGHHRTGSVAAAKKLSPMQQLVVKQVTGALRTSAGDVLKVHANLLPIDLLFCKVLTRAAVCLASLPVTHPLHSPVRSAVKRLVRRHRSPLHNLFHFSGIVPEQIEEIKPVRHNPGYRPSFSTHILTSKEEALEAIEEAFDKSNTAVFCNGSGFEGGVRASAVLYINGDEVLHLKYHLGSGAEHTAYEVEIVGLSLGLHILQGLNRKLLGLTMCGSDSQATLRALNNQRPHPAHYLLDRVHTAAENLHKKQDRLINSQHRRAAAATVMARPPRSTGVVCLQLHWSPGHKGFSPNERANTLAKEAATGSSSPWSLLVTTHPLEPRTSSSNPPIPQNPRRSAELPPMPRTYFATDTYPGSPKPRKPPPLFPIFATHCQLNTLFPPTHSGVLQQPQGDPHSQMIPSTYQHGPTLDRNQHPPTPSSSAKPRHHSRRTPKFSGKFSAQSPRPVHTAEA